MGGQGLTESKSGINWPHNMERYIQETTLPPIRMTRSARKGAGSKRHQAGTDFLSRIHDEIFAAKPQWEKDLAQKELDELAGKDEDMTPFVPPPLNAESMGA